MIFIVIKIKVLWTDWLFILILQCEKRAKVFQSCDIIFRTLINIKFDEACIYFYFVPNRLIINKVI